MRALIDYFIKNELAGNILMIFLFLVGLFGLSQMKSTFFPETESRIISIQAVYPGSSPEEIEEGIVSKIEENLKGVTGVERVTSISSENAGSITVEVIKGYDPDNVLQDVKNAVDRIASFPVGMEPLVVYKLENLGRAITFAVYGDVSLQTLKKRAREIEKDLLKFEGLSKVEITGFPDEEIEITFTEEGLRSNNLTFDEAVNKVRNTNLELTGGTIKTDSEELLIRADNKEYAAKSFQDIVIKSNPNGGIVRLSDVAEIKDKWADSPNRNYIDGVPAVIVNVQNTLEEDMIGITDIVRQYIEEYNESNEDIRIKTVSDASITLRQRIDLLLSNGIVGFIIVLILLAMFLHYRLAFWVALAIPISFAGMFLFASMLGITLNVISLFGMIVVIGILVDDGIVIAENIFQQYEKGEPPLKAALNGTMEVLPAVFSAIITTVIAFSTFFFIDGRLGDVFRELSIVVIFSLVFSLIEGAIILPAHIAHSKALNRDIKPNIVTRNLDKLMSFMRDKLYTPILNFAINYSWPIVGICVATLLMVGGAFAGGFIKSTFFPVLPRDDYSVNLQLPSGTREHITNEILTRIEQVTLEVNESLSKEFYGGKASPIERIERTIGPQTHIGSIRVSLLDGETRGDLSARQVIAAVRDKLGPVPEAESLTFGSVSFFGKPISVSLLGTDRDELKRAILEVKKGLSQVKDLKDIVDNNQEGLKEISLELKPKAYNLGLTLRDVVTQVRQGFFGAEAQRIQRGVDEVRVWLRYGEEDRSDITDLADMRVRTQNGLTVPLSELADFKTERGIININRIEGEREVRIEADVASDDVSISDVTSDVREIILPRILKDFPSVRASFEGQEREQAKTSKSLKLVLPIILLLMFFVIILTFRSVSQALLVFALLPFGFIGVGVGHWIQGLPISLFSFLGVIALVGIFVNDALVFITTFNERIKAGLLVKDAIYETGRARFRPILLTSLTTIAGLAPLILEKSLQAQFLIPMAISVAYGLLAGTFILLVLIPALLIIISRIKQNSFYVYSGEWIDSEHLEPAHPERTVKFGLFFFGALFSLIVFFGIMAMLFKIFSNLT